MAEALALLRAALAGHRITAAWTPFSARLTPADPTGFTVWMEDRGGPAVVGFDGWHEAIAEPSAAVRRFLLGLGEGCRLRVQSRLGVRHRWTLEVAETAGWIPASEVGARFYPWLFPARTVVLQNHRLPAPPPVTSRTSRPKP
jgi:hypothetical protein